MAKNGNPINIEIKNWLEGERDFKKGIDLLEDNAPNMRTLIKHIRHKETPENVEHLAYQLFKLSGMTDESICYRPFVKVVNLPDSKVIQIPKVKSKKQKGETMPRPNLHGQSTLSTGHKLLRVNP